MPPRLNKRQQREQDELLSLGRLSIPIESSDEDTVTQPGNVLSFASLAKAEESEEQDEEESPQRVTKKKSKKKKKDTASQSHNVPRNSVQKALPKQTPSQKHSAKKGKGSAKNDDPNDLDKALAELSLKYPDLQHINRSAPSQADERSLSDRQNALLSVSLSHLDSEAELRRFFGSKVVSASKTEMRKSRGGRAAIQGLKSNLTKPQPTWWSASQREGLSIRLLNNPELEEKEMRIKFLIQNERWWTVDYSQRYRSVTRAFVRAVMSGDPEQFWRILSNLPWHADTLLQVSEVYRHREEHSQAVDFLNRALFTYERSFIGAFSFTTGSNRLDFSRVENRPFYLALGRMIADLQRRGCNRTAFEFARLLLSLDPYTDPHGALLYIDYLAIKCGMYDWLLDFWDLHEAVTKASESYDLDVAWHKFNVTVLPNWIYARALALRSKEEANKTSHEGSTAALREAITVFPSIVPLIADKADVVLPGELRGHPAFRIHVDSTGLSGFDPLIHLLSHLYAHRSAPLWKVSDRATWFKDVALSTFRSLAPLAKPHSLRERFDKQFTYSSLHKDIRTPEYALLHSELSRSIYRHAATLADASAARRLAAFFPREVSEQTSLSCDPLPPVTNRSLYNEEFFSGSDDIFAFQARTRRQQEADVQMLRRMVPDENVRNQIQALYDAHPELQQQFPGGVAQFAQVAAQFGDDVWDNLLQPLMLGDHGRMPGEFEVEEDEGGDEDIEVEGPLLDYTAQMQRDEPVSQQIAGPSHEDLEEHNDREEDDADGVGDAVPIYPVRILRNLVNRFWGGGGTGQQDDSESDSDHIR